MAVWDWSHDSVVAGSPVTVTVTAAPCRPVTVTLYIRGTKSGSGQVASPPGSVEISVPSGTQGADYEIIVSCNGQSDSQGGTVG